MSGEEQTVNNGRHDNNIYRNLNRRQHAIRKRRQRRLSIILILVIVLCVIWVVALFALSRLWKKDPGPSDTTAPVVTDTDSGDDSEQTTTPAVTEPVGPKYISIKMNKSEVKKGDLILINADFPFAFPTNHEATLKTIYGNKNNLYKVSRSDSKLRTDLVAKLNDFFTEFNQVSGKKDVQVTSAYRSFADQEKLYNTSVASVGAVETAKFVALPGNSEHHLGTAVDLNILSSDDGKTYELAEFPEYAWVTDNIHKYGFILRYPEDKIGMTGIGYEPWHFRYVGVPHSYVIKDKSFCLEEYTAYIRTFPYTGEHLKVEANGKKYEIYYVACAEGENAATDVPVPDGLEYTVSGNNVDGFVVTVTLK